jgi:hypothetical protein
MVAIDISLTMLYVIGDDLCKTSLPPEHHPGLPAILSRREAVTLAISLNVSEFVDDCS